MAELSTEYLKAYHEVARAMLSPDTHAAIREKARPKAGGRSFPRPGPPQGMMPAGPITSDLISGMGMAQPAPVAKADDVHPTMVAHFLKPELATKLSRPGQQPPDMMHMTVDFLGDGTPDDHAKVSEIVRDFAKGQPPVAARIGGVGRFIAKADYLTAKDGAHLVHATVDSPGLEDLRSRLADALAAGGIAPGPEDHGFVPHVTLGVSDSPDVSAWDDVQPEDFTIDSLTAAQGDTRHTYPLQGAEATTKAEAIPGDAPGLDHPSSAAADGFALEVPLWKSDGDEAGLLYGVVLVPGQLDSQDDFVSAEEIEKAAHEFLTVFREQGVQHTGDASPDLQVVESYIAPMDMLFGDRPVPKGSWLMTTRTDPGGPIWQGVKEGRQTGFSMQGSAVRKAV